MRHYVHSVGYAVTGIRHAFWEQRNFRLFCLSYALSLIVGLALRLDPGELPAVILAGGTFLAIELLNTALEHLCDAFDTHSRKEKDHYWEAIKCTKDIAAGAALVSGCTWVLVVFIVYWPHVLVFSERLIHNSAL